MRKMVKDFIRSLMGMFGLRLIRTKNIKYLFTDSLEDFFVAIKGLGFAPKHIVDIGANHGEWTRAAFKYFPNAHYTLVEPQDDLKKHVQELIDRGCKIRWVNMGVSDRAGTMPLNIASEDHSCTFVATDRFGHSVGTQQITVAVKTLNEIVSGMIPPPEMVKIDAEGFDLKVLAGASDLLGKTDIFLVEAMVCGHFENSIGELMKFMSDAGYRLLDITTPKRSPKHGLL